ncbi:MAG: hypothetical protein ACRD92_05310 [Nitrosopumilaceae archaeon]
MNYLIISIIIAIGSLTSLVLLIIYSEPVSISNYTYDGIEDDDLVTRRALIGVSSAIENIPSRNCFQIDDNDLRVIPNLRQIIFEAKTIADYPEPDIQPNGVYTGFAGRVPTEKALDLIKKYKFNATKIQANDNFNKIPDFRYNFNCFFDYNGDQYLMNVDFETYYWGDGRIVQVNFTKNDIGIPLVENQNITVFTGGFNSTVAFNNQLDHEITVITQSPEYEGFELGIEKEVRIPPGKVLSNYLPNWSVSGDVIYKYFVKPDNLEGTIILKQYPRCMTFEEAKSLYSQVNLNPGFPSYFPQGYRFQCGIHSLNSHLITTYTNEKLRSMFPDDINSWTSNEFLVNGGIRIDYVHEFNPWMKDPQYDKLSYAKQYAGPDGNLTDVKGNPAAFSKEYTWYEGKGRGINNLWLFLDDDEKYRLQGGLSQDELLKIAESLFN